MDEGRKCIYACIGCDVWELRKCDGYNINCKEYESQNDYESQIIQSIGQLHHI